MAEIPFLLYMIWGVMKSESLTESSKSPASIANIRLTTCVSYSGMLECEIYRQNKSLKERTNVYLRKKSEDHGLKGKNQQGNEAVDQ